MDLRFPKLIRACPNKLWKSFEKISYYKERNNYFFEPFIKGVFMKLAPEVIKQLEKDLSEAKSYEDLMGKDGVIKRLLKSSLENILESELSDHLGYERHSPLGINSGNSRNGKTYKTIKTDQGQIEIKIPRDRQSSFEPVVIKKYGKTLGPIEDKIISMYAKGMTTRDIQSHVEEIYGLDISPTTVSKITDSIVLHAKEW